MEDSENFSPQSTYSGIVLSVVLFFCLLFCYNGLWNIALYPAGTEYVENLGSFMDKCKILTPATLIAGSFGALSVLELICTVEDKEWRTIVEMILWSLLTILMNSYTAYLISSSNKSSMSIWMILIVTSFVNIIWYIYTIILLKRYKCLHELAKKIKQEENTQEKVEIGTKDLAYNLLRKIGGNPQETEEGGIKFDFQGVTFLMEAVDDCCFANLILPWCNSFSKFNIDEFARVRQIVNVINMRGSVSVFYSITDSDEVAVHIKKNFLLVQQIPNLEGYFKLILDSFFRTARSLDIDIEKYRLQESER